MGVLVGLALKAGLDSAYAKAIAEQGPSTFADLQEILWSAPSVQVFVFLITLLRFVYGAHRLLDCLETQQPKLEWWTSLWNIFGMLMLFVFFYMSGLSVRHPVPFYTCVVAVHVWDWIWFNRFTSSSDSLPTDVKVIMRRFMWLDAATVVALVPMIAFIQTTAVWLGAIIMIILAVVDAWWNFSFLFPKSDVTFKA